MAHADIHADTHVFGSTRGYGTVASSRGVREDEARELESFQFGEASTADRIARLETHAVMTGRALRSGRFAISRMMPAGVDDAGRPTIEVITLLVEARDYAACVGALPQLASDARFWLDARATAASGARIAAVGAEPAPRDPQVLRLFDLWRGALRAGAIGVVSESESDAVLRLVASLDPADLLRCRWGIGLLSISTPADICSVASGVSMHGARDVLRPAQQGSWHCGSESEYAAFRAAQMPTLPSVADIEANGHTLVVAGDDGPMPAATVASPRRDARERRLMPLAIGSAVLSTAVLAVAVVMYGRRELASIVVPLPSATEEKSTTNPAEGGGSLFGASPPSAPPPSTPPATAPSTPPATAPSTPPATAPSTPPEPAPSTPAAAPSTPLVAAPSMPSAPSSGESAAGAAAGRTAQAVSAAPEESEAARLLRALKNRIESTPWPTPKPDGDGPDIQRQQAQAMLDWIRAAYEAHELDRWLKACAVAQLKDPANNKSDPETAEMIRDQSGFVTKFNMHSAFGPDDWTNPKLLEPYRDFRAAFVKAIEAAKLSLGDLEKIKWPEVIKSVGFSEMDLTLPRERPPPAKKPGEPDRWADVRRWVSRKESFESFEGFLEQLCKPQRGPSKP